MRPAVGKDLLTGGLSSGRHICGDAYVRRVQDRRRPSREYGSAYQGHNQPQYPSQHGHSALPAASQATQVWWEQEQGTRQSSGVQEQRSSGQPLGNRGSLGQPSGQPSGHAQQAQPMRKVAPVPQPKAPREISLPQDVTARHLASLLGNSSI